MSGLRLLALGDSYTIGEGVADGERWPEQWCAARRERGIAMAPPRIIARTGWTTDELAAAMDAAEPLGQWDLASLLIGVNNQYRGRDVHEYHAQFAALLDRAIIAVGDRPERVRVLSIPDWGVTPFARSGGHDPGLIAAQIDAYNAINHAEAARRGAPWLDITDLTRAYGADPEMLAADGLHPSGLMYTLWVDRMLETFP